MYRIFTEFYRICHATFRIMKIHEESELCITNATFQNYDSADINNHPHKHPINTNKTCFFYIYSWELNLSLFMKIQLPVKVEVCVLDIFTQEQYHVKSFWEKIGPPLIHYLTCDSKQPLTIGAGWWYLGWTHLHLGRSLRGLNLRNSWLHQSDGSLFGTRISAFFLSLNSTLAVFLMW